MNFIKITQRFFSVFFIFIISAFMCEAGSGISVDRTSVAFDMDSEEEQRFVVEVQNISSYTQNIDIKTVDYLVGDDNEITLSDEVGEDSGVRDWVSVENESIALESGQKKKVLFTAKTPKNANVGSHHGVVLFKFGLSDGNETSIGTSGQIGVHILINVKGDTYASGRINSFDLPLFTTEPIVYTAEFENLGNIHYVPYGEVVVRNVFTKKEEAYKYEKHFVFPNRKYTFILTNPAPSIFGLYKAQVTFVDGEGAVRTKTDYTMGYLFPLVFFAIMVLIFLITRYLKKENKQKLKP